MENKEKLLAIIEKAKEEKSIAEKAIIYADAKIEVAIEMLKDDEVEVVEEQVQEI